MSYIMYCSYVYVHLRIFRKRTHAENVVYSSTVTILVGLTEMNYPQIRSRLLEDS